MWGGCGDEVEAVCNVRVLAINDGDDSDDNFNNDNNNDNIECN